MKIMIIATILIIVGINFSAPLENTVASGDTSLQLMDQAIKKEMGR